MKIKKKKKNKNIKKCICWLRPKEVPFYSEEKRQTEERETQSPVHFNCSPPAREGSRSTERRGTVTGHMTSLQPITDQDTDMKVKDGPIGQGVSYSL